MLHTLRGKLCAAMAPRTGRPRPRRPAGNLAFESLEPRLVLNSGPLVISEFVADNETGIFDEDGRRSDWIEIHNPTTLPVNLDGWYLTDNANNLEKWAFPEIVLEPGHYQLVFASGKNSYEGELHTNFELDNDGEYLGLIQPDGQTVSHDYSPNYPAQRDGISFGMGQGVTALTTEESDFAYRIPTDGTEALDWTDVDYDDSSWGKPDDGVRNAEPSILITEIGYGSPDYIEIQNVSNQTVDTSGWVLACNYGITGDINNVHDTSWSLPDTMAPGEVIHVTDLPTDEEYIGYNVFWGYSGTGWAMIVDETGGVADFLPWRYSAEEVAQMRTTVAGFEVFGANAWNGPGMSTSIAQPSLRRVGGMDTNSDSDFISADIENRGLTNPEITLPVIGNRMPGVGYSMVADGFGEALQTDIGPQLVDVNSSLYVRIPFEVDDPAEFDTLQLRLKYNDGFVAYLNGRKVAERLAPAEAQWDSAATGKRSVADSTTVEVIGISESLDALRPGSNVLAIHALNAAADDEDFLLVSQLLAIKSLGANRFMLTPTPGEPNESELMVAAQTVFSEPSGTFTEPFTLELSLPPDQYVGDIRYTLDGTDPTIDSPVYTDPISISTTTRVKTRIFEEDTQPGPVATGSYVLLAADMQSFTSDLPIVVIENFGAGTIPPTGSTLRQDAFMAIFEPSSSTMVPADDARSAPINAADLTTRIGIRARGRSSGNWPKHHYSVESRNEYGLDKDIEPLGMPAESDWILSSFYQFDRAMMRNPLMYELSNQAGRYAVRTTYVEVFVNQNGGPLTYTSDYFGVYTLSEKIKIGPDRVDVAELEPTDNEPPEITGGYVLKIDSPDPGDSTFSAGGLNSLNYVDPERLELTAQQRNYVVSTFNQAGAALNGVNFKDPELGYAQYIDAGAWIDHHWLNFLALNPDAFRLSGYMHKDRDGKIAAGPVWDFDRTMESLDGRDDNPYGWQGNGNDFFHYGWYNRLFQDPNFAQANVDRWYELREDVFSTENIMSIIDSFADRIREASVRNFAKWSNVAPRFGSWQGEVDHLKDWLTKRTGWIDSLFQPIPTMDHPGGTITAPLDLTLAATKGTIYYTLDGTDPRGFGGTVAETAIEYVPGVPITLDDSALVTARTFVPGNFAAPYTNWSAPIEREFLARTPAAFGNLLVTELNYHPYPAFEGEGEAGQFSEGDFEFIEVMNVGDEVIDLAGVTFVEGVDARLAVVTLAPGERAVVVDNLDAFQIRYGSDNGVKIAGEFSGNLDNNGERIEMRDRFGQVISRFTYSDSGEWPGRADGNGSSLEMVDLIRNPNDGSNWTASVDFGGSPGRAGKASETTVVINEVATNTIDPALDTIELHNATDTPIDIGGWYLSDSSGDFLKFRIPDGTQIDAQGYRLFDEDDFNPSRGVDPVEHSDDFEFSGVHGGDIWLWKVGPEGKPTEFVDHVEFGAAGIGETLGRWPADSYLFDNDLYRMSSPTLGFENSGPKIGSVILSEVHYHPAGGNNSDREFVELYNTTETAIDLTGWRLGSGIDFYFEPGTIIDAGSTLVVVPFDPALPADARKLAAFRDTYLIGDSVELVGGYLGKLDNAGERVRLLRPDTSPPDEPDFIPYVVEDEIDYDDRAPWPRSADGDGPSLTRVAAGAWGLDPASWVAATPTPGSFETFNAMSPAAEVTGRHVFYNDSMFDGNDAAAESADDNAIAPDKQALLPGGVAAQRNYTNYVRGINGIMVDVASLADAENLNASDFTFLVGNRAELDSWTPGPAPTSITVRPGEGVEGADRVTILFADNAIQNQWLQVSVLATAHTGLMQPDVFYFGNAIGEAGDQAGNAIVNATDEIAARNFRHGPLNPAAVDDPYDYNRDALVDGSDQLIARNHQTNPRTSLRLITAPQVDTALAEAAEELSVGNRPVADAAWLHEFEQSTARRSPKETKTHESAVDELLATGRW